MILPHPSSTLTETLVPNATLCRTSEGRPSLAFSVIRSEIQFDCGEEIPANDAIYSVIPINRRHMGRHDVEDIVHAETELIFPPDIILNGQVVIDFCRDMLPRIGFIRVGVQFIGRVDDE